VGTNFLTDARGEIIEVIGISRNITHRKKAEEALKGNQEELTKAYKQAQSASKAKSEFLTSMTHELRTPLNAILGYAQLLKDDERLEDEQKRKINIIEKSGKHLLNLINDLLDIAKIEAKKTEIEKHYFNFWNLLSFVEEIIRVKTNLKELSFIVEYSRDLPDFVIGDEKKLSQILINLLNNAVKFTHRGKITFKVEKKDKKLLFSVEDTGIGIEDEKKEDIFSPFKQLSDCFRKTEGTGLGLTISRNLVKLMGGDLQVESIYGKGSKFWFEIELPESLPIVWVYKEKNTLSPGGNKEEENIMIPDEETVKFLYELTENGKLNSIKKELEKIKSSDKKYEAFYNKIKKLTDAFEMKNIKILLKKYLEKIR
jgi:signal transduction histidine kinase